VIAAIRQAEWQMGNGGKKWGKKMKPEGRRERLSALIER